MRNAVMSGISQGTSVIEASSDLGREDAGPHSARTGQARVPDGVAGYARAVGPALSRVARRDRGPTRSRTSCTGYATPQQVEQQSDSARPAQRSSSPVAPTSGMIDLSKLDRPPAGFGACVECAYRDTGSAPIYFACASEHTEAGRLRPGLRVCGQALPTADGRCAGIPSATSTVATSTRVWAISMRTGQMQRGHPSRYKYDGRWGWGGDLRSHPRRLPERAPRATFGALTTSITPRPDVPSTTRVRAPELTITPGGIIEAAEIEEPIRLAVRLRPVIAKTTADRAPRDPW